MNSSSSRWKGEEKLEKGGKSNINKLKNHVCFRLWPTPVIVLRNTGQIYRKSQQKKKEILMLETFPNRENARSPLHPDSKREKLTLWRFALISLQPEMKHLNACPTRPWSRAETHQGVTRANKSQDNVWVWEFAGEVGQSFGFKGSSGSAQQQPGARDSLTSADRGRTAAIVDSRRSNQIEWFTSSFPRTL